MINIIHITEYKNYNNKYNNTVYYINNNLKIL
jgi:hypothetical protein